MTDKKSIDEVVDKIDRQSSFGIGKIMKKIIKQELTEYVKSEKERCLEELLKCEEMNGKLQVISKKRLKYQMGWCNGRNELREEIKQKINELQEGK